MVDIRLMRLSPLALTFIWSRWTVTSGGWEFNRVGRIAKGDMKMSQGQLSLAIRGLFFWR
jgi:hypothetical protein